MTSKRCAPWSAAWLASNRAVEQNGKLHHQLPQLRRTRFGRSSELQLALEDIEQAVARGEAEEERATPKLNAARAKARSPSHPSLPAHLPRIEVAVAPEDTACPDCRAVMHLIGEETSELAPLVGRLREMLLGSARLAADETPAPVLDPGRGRTKTGYFRVIARDDRPWGGADPPAVVYSYAPGRGAEQGVKPLAG